MTVGASIEQGVAALMALTPEQRATVLQATDETANDWEEARGLITGPDGDHIDALVKYNMEVARIVRAREAGE